MAWKRKACEFIEYENIHSIHFDSSSITAVSAANLVGIVVFAQVKSGYIYIVKFDEATGFKKTDELISCGTFTFCRMNLLELDGKIILAYPSNSVENAVNVITIHDNNKDYLLKDHLVQGSGMCLFTKLKKLKDSRIILVCGYESGKLSVLDCSNRQVLFEGKCFEGGESCTDADLYEDNNLIKLIVTGTGKIIKVFNDFDLSSAHDLIIPFAGCNAVTTRSDGKLFVTGGWDCKLRFFSLKNVKPLAIIDHHFEAITAVEILENNEIVAASSDGTISIWSLF